MKYVLVLHVLYTYITDAIDDKIKTCYFGSFLQLRFPIQIHRFQRPGYLPQRLEGFQYDPCEKQNAVE